MRKNIKKVPGNRSCPDCGPLPKNHTEKYIESIVGHVLPKCPPVLALRLERLFSSLFLWTGLWHQRPYHPSPTISSRSTVFMQEAEKRGWKLFSLESPWGPAGHFQFQRKGKTYSFEGLPRAEFLENHPTKVDDKALVKKTLRDFNIPTPEGRCFRVFEMKRALRYGSTLGFPLVVKPRSGSISQHVFVSIENKEMLHRALRSVFSFEPYAIVEKFLPNVKTYRATVIDFDKIAVVERTPAHIIGDGHHTVQDLIDRKNNDPRRGKPKQKDTTLYRLVFDHTSEKLLRKQGYHLYSIPKPKEQVFLQEKVILDLGADLFEVTTETHPDNLKLFEQVARIFNIHLVGIDFLTEDIAQSWKNSPAAIIELNSLPYIDMHHFPTEGQPVNVAGFVCDLVEKYYNRDTS